MLHINNLSCSPAGKNQLLHKPVSLAINHSCRKFKQEILVPRIAQVLVVTVTLVQLSIALNYYSDLVDCLIKRCGPKLGS